MVSLKDMGDILIGVLIWFMRGSGRMARRMVKEYIDIEEG